MKIKLVKYTPYTNQKFLGIAEILIEDKICLRYKLVHGKDGRGIYCQPNSYCVEDPSGNTYIKCFDFDSNLLKEEIESLVKKAHNSTSVKPATQASTFKAEPETEEHVPF